jgi:glycosyltransferase involved in cell wall biosynthesis
LSLLSPLNPRHWFAILAALCSLRRQALAAAADGRVAHVLALWILPSGWAARIVARTLGIRYSVWALGSDIWSLGRLPVVKGVLATIISEAEVAYADGLQLARDAEALSGRHFEFMPSCRALSGDRERPVADAAPYRFLFLGRWHPNKGTDLLFDALDQLDDDDWHRIAEIEVAGGGHLRPLVEQRVRRLTDAGRPLRLTGFLNRAEAERALARADRLLLPSRIESIPVVFSDALAYGIPVVSMPVGDLPGLLAGGGGWLASRVDGDAFAQAIRSSLDPAPGILNQVHELKERFRVAAVARAFVETRRSAS